jgi:beta-1,4-mannosyltransferase
MLISSPARDQGTEGWLSETFASVARMPIDGPDPIVWPFTPYYTGNPFQSLLYGRFADQGMVAAGSFRTEDLRAATQSWPSDLPLVVHLHWLNQVLAKAGTAAEAKLAADRHTQLLDLLKARGARLVWTVHNTLPHDLRFEAQEVRMRRDVIDRIDLVHMMSPRTPELVSEWFTLPPDRLYHCDHPGYQGVYPDWVTRTDARRRLRVPEDAVVLLLTGALKPYKGLNELFDAVDQVAAERPGSVVLLVAGKPDDAPETQTFLSRAGAHPAVRLLPRKIPDTEIQVLMRAADIVALPYRRSLNSGVLALALSFGRPVLLPANSGSVPLVDDGAGLIYPSDDHGALVDAVRACLSLDLDAAGRAAVVAGSRIDRATLAWKFAHDLRRWADTGTVETVAQSPVAQPRSSG